MCSFHTPVMLREVAQSLRCKRGGIYLDGTVGGGGHAEEILRLTAPDGLLIGIDLDEDALAESHERLKCFGERVILVKGNFADLDSIVAGIGIKSVDGILLDLGVSSHQLKSRARGFSFSLDAPLDMRMDRSRPLTAHDVVNSFPEEKLGRIIREYGEETMAGRIVRAVSKKRSTAPIRTTAELAAIIARALPPAARKKNIHPATKTFQAIRIFVNDELVNLRRAIANGVPILERGGRISIVSFHSLEDRIVKDAFRSLEKGCICPADFPVCACGRKGEIKVLTRRPITPSEQEVAENPRARSARLRTAERI